MIRRTSPLVLLTAAVLPVLPACQNISPAPAPRHPTTALSLQDGPVAAYCPKNGMLFIYEAPTVKQGTIQIGGKNMNFRVITFDASRKESGEEKVKVTIVAGALSDGVNDSDDTRGIKPPTDGDFTEGLDICGSFPPEVTNLIELRAGFMWVTVTDDPRMGVRPNAVPWPIILRNKTVAAGAQGTDFVLIGTERTPRETSDRAVYRPNQDNNDDCQTVGDDDNNARKIVHAQIATASDCILNQDKYAMIDKPRLIRPKLDPNPTKDKLMNKRRILREDKTFLVKACEFRKEALKQTNVSEVRLPDCVSIPANDRPTDPKK
jgi:hypothetical protein